MFLGTHGTLLRDHQDPALLFQLTKSPWESFGLNFDILYLLISNPMRPFPYNPSGKTHFPVGRITVIWKRYTLDSNLALRSLFIQFDD
eukprot:UN03368